MWLLIDNYDSFTHILHHYLQQVAGEDSCEVIKNDTHSLQQIRALNPSRIILSPGPETPLQAGVTMKVIEYFHDKIPILGVCLGHQALGMFYGASLVHAPFPMHGKQSAIMHEPHLLFYQMPQPFKAMRYHSLCVNNLPVSLKAIAYSEDGVVQAMLHEKFPSVGVQFHPESIGTDGGLKLLQNWKQLYAQ